MSKKKIIFLTSAIIVIISAIVIHSFLSNNPESEIIPPQINDEKTDFEEYVPKATARLNFSSGNYASEVPTHMIKSYSAPRRLEITLYNVQIPDINPILETFKALYFVKDAYRTIVLDDSVVRFTVELNTDISYTASEYNGEYVNLEFSPVDVNDDTVYIVRSSSSKMNESLALLCESVADYNPSIVKTSDDKFCITFNCFSTLKSADEFLNKLPSDEFFTEESTVFSNPK